MTQHTPGPWEVIGNGWHVSIVRADDNNTTICDTQLQEDSYETIANANLIAAAPDLLAACKAMLGIDMPPAGEPGHIDYTHAVHMAAAAIVKARDGTS